MTVNQHPRAIPCPPACRHEQTQALVSLLHDYVQTASHRSLYGHSETLRVAATIALLQLLPGLAMFRVGLEHRKVEDVNLGSDGLKPLGIWRMSKCFMQVLLSRLRRGVDSLGKTLMLGKEKWVAEDEVVGWHH